MAKKVLVSVINAKGSLTQIPVGTSVVFEKDNGNSFDQMAIKVLADGSEIGFVSSSANTIVSGCISNKEFHPMIKGDKIEGVVVKHDKIKFMTNVERTALVVEVQISNKQSNTNSVAKGGNVAMVKYVAKIKGSTRAYPGKLTIMSEFNNGKPVFVSLKREGDNVVAFLADTPAGIVEESKNQDTTNYEDLAEVVKIMTTVTGKVISVNAQSYIVEFELEEKTIKDAKNGKKVVTFEDIKNGIVAQGICTMGELNEIEEYLTQSGLSRKLIIDIFNTYRKYDEDVAGRIPQRPSTLFKDYFGGVKKACVYICKGKHLRFIGEKGTGKNNLITTLAWVFKRPLFELSLNSQFDKADLVGTKTIHQGIDEHGKEYMCIGFDKEAFIEAMEVGGFVNLDEVNTADPSVLVQLHSVCDDRGSLQVAGYGKVVAKENFAIILTMNADYQGTVTLNEATRDRFTPVLFPSNTSIAEMLQAKFPQVDPDYIRYCDQLYAGMLGLVKDEELSMDCMTVRGFIDALEVAEDLGLQEALIDNVANRIDDADYRTTVLNRIDEIVG